MRWSRFRWSYHLPWLLLGLVLWTSAATAYAEPPACAPDVVGPWTGEVLDAGQVLVLAGGTGSPFFTTDTCAALRASDQAGHGEPANPSSPVASPSFCFIRRSASATY